MSEIDEFSGSEHDVAGIPMLTRGFWRKNGIPGVLAEKVED